MPKPKTTKSPSAAALRAAREDPDVDAHVVDSRAALNRLVALLFSTLEGVRAGVHPDGPFPVAGPLEARGPGAYVIAASLPGLQRTLAAADARVRDGTFVGTPGGYRGLLMEWAERIVWAPPAALRAVAGHGGRPADATVLRAADLAEQVGASGGPPTRAIVLFGISARRIPKHSRGGTPVCNICITLDPTDGGAVDPPANGRPAPPPPVSAEEARATYAREFTGIAHAAGFGELLDGAWAPLLARAPGPLAKAERTSVARRALEAEGKACAGCGRTAAGMKRCAACKLTYYCGKACQTGDWPTHRGATCGARRLCTLHLTLAASGAPLPEEAGV